MDYEKAYKEALERARTIHDAEFSTYKATMEEVFPELRESEDEKIRKEIEYIIQTYRDNCINEGSHRFDDCLAWLEKQKPTLSKGDEEHLNNAIWACLHEYGKDSDTAEWLKSLVEQL